MTTPSTDDRDLLERVHEDLNQREAGGTVARITLGSRLVAAELDRGARTVMGAAHRPAGSLDEPVPADANELSTWSFDPPADDPVAAALGVAALNARSVGTIPWRAGDPMAALDPDVERIATVGLFRAAFRRFGAVDVRVIEREPVGAVEAPAGVSVSTFTPDEAAAAIDGVEVLFVTGSSLLYGGTTAYLRAAAEVPTVVLIGATASFIPAPAFDAGVDVVAGARVTDGERVRQGIVDGRCGTDLHDAGLEKVYVAAGGGPDGLELDGDA